MRDAPRAPCAPAPTPTVLPAERSGEGALGVSSGYHTTKHAHAQKKAKRSSQAEHNIKRGTRTRTNSNQNDTKEHSAGRRGVRARSANGTCENQGAWVAKSLTKSEALVGGAHS
jgi:hypothetical protein